MAKIYLCSEHFPNNDTWQSFAHLNLSRLLSEQGHDVSYLCYQSPDQVSELPKKVKLLQAFSRKKTDLSSLGFLTHILQERGSVFHFLDPNLNHKWLHPFSMLASISCMQNTNLISFFDVPDKKQWRSLRSFLPLIHACSFNFTRFPEVQKIQASFSKAIQIFPLLPAPGEGIELKAKNRDLFLIPGNVDRLILDDQQITYWQRLAKAFPATDFLILGNWGQMSSADRKLFWRRLESFQLADRLQVLGKNKPIEILGDISLARALLFFGLKNYESSDFYLQSYAEMHSVPCLYSYWDKNLLQDCYQSENLFSIDDFLEGNTSLTYESNRYKDLTSNHLNRIYAAH